MKTSGKSIRKRNKFHGESTISTISSKFEYKIAIATHPKSTRQSWQPFRKDNSDQMRIKSEIFNRIEYEDKGDATEAEGLKTDTEIK